MRFMKSFYIKIETIKSYFIGNHILLGEFFHGVVVILTYGVKSLHSVQRHLFLDLGLL